MAARRPTGRTADLVATLERVLEANPDHIGAIHLYIHAVEASDQPKRAEPYADRLAAQNLSTGHLIHMPAHIYFRVGRYLDSLEANKVASAADEAYLAQVQAGGIYPYAYYPHNVHFVLVSAQMAGDAATVLDAAAKLDKVVTEEAARTVPLAQPVKAAPLFAYAQFGTPEQILALPAPADDLPYLKGLWHYARGVALAAKGDVAAAQAEADAIAAIGKDSDLETLKNTYGIPAADVLQARAAHRAGAHRAGERRPEEGDRRVRDGRGDRGLAPLHGAGLLVLSGEAVARRNAAPCRRDGAGRGRLQGEPRRGAEQRLGVLRAARSGEAARRHRRGDGFAGAARAHLGGRPRAARSEPAVGLSDRASPRWVSCSAAEAARRYRETAAELAAASCR